MNETKILTELVAGIILPPGSLILAFIAAVILMWRSPTAARVLVSMGTVILYVLSIPAVAEPIARLQQSVDALDVNSRSLEHSGAIVVLGGGMYRDGPEFGSDSLRSPGLERVRYAAWLHQRTGLPILVTGGVKGDEDRSGDVMARVLRDEFGVSVQWSDTDAHNTRENALRSRTILEPEAIHKIVLVTSAYHMPRARRAFEQVGFEVVPAPTIFAVSNRPISVLSFVPDGRLLKISVGALREWLARGWYAISY